MVEIIAEIGQNHNGDMDLAKEMIRTAKDYGADVAKFQLFDPEKIFTDKSDPWYDYNRKTELTEEAVKCLADECEKVGIEFMASVFDVERVSWLERIGVKRHKVASRSIRETELIDAMCKTGKPLLVSLGMWDSPEFPVIKTAADVGFLYCVSEYPTDIRRLNFASVDFERYLGFSDHTVGVLAPMAAMARGARIIEKHFTLDKGMYGPDHKGSMTPDELTQIHEFRLALGEML